ncbi:DUF3611 family protein [Aerosakkonema sp. BLCC-F183]|uniref:DUF3611 family protein n=1 Tax=Aerosakkonema sp. BLCC-F183 TaxID=3342834 RepID=UPI0035BA30D3
MQTQSETSLLTPTKQKVITLFRLLGWLSFWVELGLAIASGLALLFSISGRNFATETNAGLGVGIFWAVAGLLALLFSIFLAFRYTRIAKHLANRNSGVHPKKADTMQMLRLGAIVSLVGIFLCLLGAGATVGVMVAKAVSQPPGVAITDPNKIIRALDVFVAVANINGIAAHFVGVVISLGLYSWLHRD